MQPLPSRFLRVVALTVVFSGVPALTLGQDGRIAGVVRAVAGQPLASARVTATHSVTRVTRSTTTTADGQYTLSGLASGTYIVAATLFGYRRASRADVQVPAPAGAIP